MLSILYSPAHTFPRVSHPNSSQRSLSNCNAAGFTSLAANTTAYGIPANLPKRYLWVILSIGPLRSTLLLPASQAANIYELNQWAPLLSAFPFALAEDQGVGAERGWSICSSPPSFPGLRLVMSAPSYEKPQPLSGVPLLQLSVGPDHHFFLVLQPRLPIASNKCLGVFHHPLVGFLNSVFTFVNSLFIEFSSICNRGISFVSHQEP